MSYNFLNGITTALITPFNNGKIDFDKLELIVANQVKANVSAILLFGTTGEPYSLSFSEKKSIFYAVKRFAPNLPIIAGVSHPSTKECVKESIRFSNLGVNAIMVTTPYFYKTLDRGIINHFSQIASKITLPIIVYNVPARTNYDLSLKKEVLTGLSKIDNIVAIKQASSDLNVCKHFFKGYKFAALCGNDSYILELLKCGYSGVISVISNVFPEKITKIYNAVKQNNIIYAEKTFNEIYALITALEKAPNPIGIKYLCSKIFNSKNELRLPLVNLKESEAKEINLELNNLLEEKIWNHYL